jgi:large subunit ribosomal protein L13e
VIIVVRFISPIVERGDRVREGKGFSKKELEAVELTMTKARSLGIPVDTRRKNSHDENIETLKEFIELAKDLDIKIAKPKFESKSVRGRVFRGKTSAGQKMRNLSHKK